MLSISVAVFPSRPLVLSQVEVYSMSVDCTVTARFAHTVMSSKALNKANYSQEIFFEMELPKTAFITNFSMLVCLHSYFLSVHILTCTLKMTEFIPASFHNCLKN